MSQPIDVGSLCSRSSLGMSSHSGQVSEGKSEQGDSTNHLHTVSSAGLAAAGTLAALLSPAPTGGALLHMLLPLRDCRVRE